MFKLTHFHSDDMALALVMYICTLPLVVFVVSTILGKKVLGLTALALFVVIMAVCWGICGWKLVRKDYQGYQH